MFTIGEAGYDWMMIAALVLYPYINPVSLIKNLSFAFAVAVFDELVKK
jgi:hypothetical protein